MNTPKLLEAFKIYKNPIWVHPCKCFISAACFFFHFQLGGGYLFGLTVGIVADSVGATMGAVVAFLIGRTVSFSNLLLCDCEHLFNILTLFILSFIYYQIGRSYVSSKLKNYPKFEAISIAIERSGFKVTITLHLRNLFSIKSLMFSSLPS